MKELKNYVAVEDLKAKLQNNEPKTRYYQVHQFNTVIIIEKFLELLKNNGYDVKIENKFQEKLQLNIRCSGTKEDKIIYKNYITYLFSDCYIYINFKINDYLYYLQFEENYLFNDSFITCNKIYYDLYNRPYINKIYIGDFNIYHCLNKDIFSLNCNYEENAKQLYNWFIKNKLEKESKIYYPHPRKAPRESIKEYL